MPPGRCNYAICSPERLFTLSGVTQDRPSNSKAPPPPTALQGFGSSWSLPGSMGRALEAPQAALLDFSYVLSPFIIDQRCAVFLQGEWLPGLSDLPGSEAGSAAVGRPGGVFPLASAPRSGTIGFPRKCSLGEERGAKARPCSAAHWFTVR